MLDYARLLDESNLEMQGIEDASVHVSLTGNTGDWASEKMET